MEQIRVDNRTYVARTLAATAAGISYSHLTKLLAKGQGPAEHYILWRDGKQFIELRAVKRWGKAKGWYNPVPKQAGRRAKCATQNVELSLSKSVVAEFRARYPNKSLSATVTDLLTTYLRSN